MEINVENGATDGGSVILGGSEIIGGKQNHETVALLAINEEGVIGDAPASDEPLKREDGSQKGGNFGDVIEGTDRIFAIQESVDSVSGGRGTDDSVYPPPDVTWTTCRHLPGRSVGI